MLSAGSREQQPSITNDELDGMRPWGLGRLDGPEPKRPVALKVPSFYALGTNEDTLVGLDALPTPKHGAATALRSAKNVSALPSRTIAQDDRERTDKAKRVVTVTPRQWQLFFSGNSIPSAQELDSQPEDSEYWDKLGRATWNKVVPEKSARNGGIALAPIPQTPLLPLAPTRSQPPRRMKPRLFLLVSIFSLLSILVAGLLSLFLAGGHDNRTHANVQPLTLQVSPSTVAFGGFITLRGAHFTPLGEIGLTRDAHIPIVDAHGTNLVHADSQGNFTSVVQVDQGWQAGPHLIYAEDAHLHKFASYPVTVNGRSVWLRPAHLLLSTVTLDLGSGDQATNSTATVTLTYGGGGEVAWQSASTQPWLLLTPTSGVLTSEQSMNVTTAADRSGLKPGAYSADVVFSSDAGEATLLVKMQVIPLQANHEAVMQLSPAVLSFTGSDGGTNPAGQIVTLNNPGEQTLQWASSTATTDGANWLSVYPPSGSVLQGSSEPLTMSVNTSSLLPGMYTGQVTFNSTGTALVVDSLQRIFVSVTILPQCALQVVPGNLTFTDAYLQPAPPTPKAISVGGSQSCSAPLQWTASATTNNGGPWLNLSAFTGTTPAYPTASINITGLTPGTYTGALSFSSSAGTQTVPITFIMGQPTTPIMATAPSMMSFSGILTQPDPAPQTITVVNNGGGALLWRATASTSFGGSWLNVSPPSGSLTANQNVTLRISVTLQGILVPGTYGGTIVISGTDSAGPTANGSPQSMPVTFNVQAPCTIMGAPTVLSFSGIAGQPDPQPQNVGITAGGACGNSLNWGANANAPWLTTTPTTGTVSPSNASATGIGVVLAGLSPNTYTAQVTITATDSVTGQHIGTPLQIKVTLVVQTPCTLQAPSISSETFTGEAGSNPATQSFTLSVIGTCSGSVTITPTASTNSGGNWLTVTPPSAAVDSGASATFTVAPTGTALTAGSYTGSIALTAVDTGTTITGSPQAVSVTLNLQAPPNLSASAPAVNMNISAGSGTASVPITIQNMGGVPLKWTAALAAGAPSFVSLSATAGKKLAGGATTTTDLLIDTTNAPPGPYSVSVTISATDRRTGNLVPGSPATVTLSFTISPPPAMQLSGNNLAFTTTAGTNPTAQTVTLTNTGGDTLNWTVGTPSATWLTVTPTGGSDTASTASTLTFSVDVTGLAAGPYTATVLITPSVGTAVTVTVNLTIN